MLSDTDTRLDIYERYAATSTYIVTTGNGPFDANYKAATPDGRSVYFETAEPIVAGDTDTKIDVYGAYEK